uniref:Cytochrome c oxidase subunit 2 n=1 Tax=Flaccisagitta enflata TaxID=366393 RepID=D3DKN2_9BILA|nr:cytochrome c oxidase subunit II [Flaccisagitta enflata]BAI68181.1 cytochrome oxidase subunit 2 [Flaccisagitta enflata]
MFQKINFHDASSPLMENLHYFHDWAMVIITSIALVSFVFLWQLFLLKPIDRSFNEQQNIEWMWTILPGVILLGIGFPSIRILYLLDENGAPSLSLKAIGHQWYWSYEYNDFNSLEFDSYMTNSSYRLIDTDHRLILPTWAHIRVLVTAADVLHSWTLPTMGIKADAIPGRLNQLLFSIDRPGFYYGQCSEICGSNHSFMPITLEAYSPSTFCKIFDSIL